MPDWGLGKYELTATDLEPVAQRVVAMASLLRHERVLDIACGTGNAALAAARFRSKVTGIDQAPRLIEVARRRAQDEGLDVAFEVGDAEKLDLPDGSFDVAVSVFGMIFAPDPDRAFGEMIRVLRAGGRGFLSVWVPGGAIDEMAGVFTRAVAEATMRSSGPPRFAWHDSAEVEAMAGRHGATVRFHEGELPFYARSPEEYLARHLAHHPMSMATNPVLEGAGTMERVRQEALEVLTRGNEDPDGFRVTSRYRILEVRR